jgi:hypothetical protein
MFLVLLAILVKMCDIGNKKNWDFDIINQLLSVSEFIHIFE